MQKPIAKHVARTAATELYKTIGKPKKQSFIKRLANLRNPVNAMLVTISRVTTEKNLCW